MNKPTACRRRFGFLEHRTMAQVRETEELQVLRNQRALPGGLCNRLNSLLCLAVTPWLDEPRPPSAA